MKGPIVGKLVESGWKAWVMRASERSENCKTSIWNLKLKWEACSPRMKPKHPKSGKQKTKQVNRKPLENMHAMIFYITL